MKERLARDVSQLPTFGFGTHSGPWWGTLGFIALEGMGFALAIGTYLYLQATNATWPLSSPPPALWMGTAMTVLLLISVIPNQSANRAAHKMDLRATRLWLVIMSLVGLATLIIRAFEFTTLNVRWDSDAYGSVVWFILGLHTTHLITDLGDTVVLTALMFTKHAQPRRFGDVTDNAFYWNFVVIAWLPLYALLYWMPRL